MKDADDFPYGRICDLDDDGKLDFMEEMLVYDLMEEDRLRSKAYFENVKKERERERRMEEEFNFMASYPSPKKVEEKKPEIKRLPESDDEFVQFWKEANFVSRAFLILAFVVLVGFISAIPVLTSEDYGFILLIGFLVLTVYMFSKFVSSREEENKEFAELRDRYLASLDEAHKAALDKRMRKERLKNAFRMAAWVVPSVAFGICIIFSSF